MLLLLFATSGPVFVRAPAARTYVIPAEDRTYAVPA